jgi:TRAP-type C4-dicarboxylate transport system permease small subunit
VRRFLDRLYDAAGVAAAVAMAAICVIMLAQAAGRSLGVPLPGADDIVAWLCAACAFLALGHTFRNGDLVRVGVFLDHLSGRSRWYAELGALGVTAIFTLYMLWACTRFVYDSYAFKEVAQGLIRVPIWIPQLSLVLGIAIFLLAVLDELITVLKHEKPTYQRAEEARAAAGDFSEKL